MDLGDCRSYRNIDFVSRCHKEADRNVQHGDFGKAMESLRKVNAKINLENVSSDINSSLPVRNLTEMSDDCRARLFTYTVFWMLFCYNM